MGTVSEIVRKSNYIPYIFDGEIHLIKKKKINR